MLKLLCICQIDVYTLILPVHECSNGHIKTGSEGWN